jgi:hypothetical protein
VGDVALSETGDGFTQLATLTLEGHGYGAETEVVAVTELMEDAHELLIDWRVQDTAAGAGSEWLRETFQRIFDDDLTAIRFRAVYTSTYISQRLCTAWGATVS